MGLSGRKQKQRIGPDPRNLTWADDASKFGQSYLSKFGWDASKGLGAEGDGMKTHLKVSQKLDLMGIGAQHTKDPNGIAWKQNKDFENVLRRLNAAAEGSGGDAEQGEEVLGGAFISSTVKEEDVEMTDKEKRKQEKMEKKRKRAEAEEAQKEVKKAKTDDVPTPAPEPAPRERVLPRHRAHRARHIAAKNRAALSATAAISEILGISSSSATPQTEPATPATPGTPAEDSAPSMEKLTVSTKSVADYFKERLLAKSASKSTSSIATVDMDDAAPARIGLGARSFMTPTIDDAMAAPRMGLGMSKFGSLMSSAFLADASSDKSILPPATDEVTTETVPVCEERRVENQGGEGAIVQPVKKAEADLTQSKEERKRLKEEKRRLKAEKRERKEAKRQRKEANAASS
ncbi:hypothetical protein CYLTODRAFT_384689 [Cylindrobasidium torrendii FP15055 ss-10]|uniref:G-patch domain-containing protein n=1 Tax=Cylindrobasidium torrendii FP15055 ss-10 TaxID=1314674 RepID=A0A0D7ASL5_9AGAR|nr:hypothetical protein CYLTODRAFT_384689 [Cylindrobasidium torrendii FP15055 ss-10]